MRNTIKILEFVCMFVMQTIDISAQTFSGTITEITSGQSVPYASVVASNDSLATRISKYYAISDNEGKFSINLSSEKIDWLIVRCMGYKTKAVAITDKKFYNIQLEELSQELNEVTIKANYSGVKYSGDTIKFDTEHFRIGTESTIGDVIKKMPGMEVSSSGQVSYAGKKIDKLLLDGNDVFSSGNNMAINTMSADAMAGAEIFTNYKTGGLADDYLSNDRLALNIKTSGKSKLYGSAEIYGGYKNKYQGRASLLNIGKKTTFNTLMSVNNVGVSAFSIEDYLNNVVGMDNIISSNKNSISLSGEESKMLITPDNVFAQTSGSITTGFTFLPSNNFKMKGNVLYAGNELKSNTQSQYTYFESGLNGNRTTKEIDKNHYLNAQLQEQWKISQAVEINSESHLSYNHYGSFGLITNSGLNALNANQDERLNKLDFRQIIGLNAKIGKGLGYLNLEGGYCKKNRDINIQTDSLLLPLDYVMYEKLYLLSQNREQTKSEFSTEIGYMHPVFSDINLRLSSSYSYSSERIDLGNTEDYKSNVLNGYVAFEKSKGLFRFNTSLKLNYMDYLNHHQTAVSLASMFKLSFSKRHELMLSGDYGAKMIGSECLSTMDYLNNYHSTLHASVIENPFNRQLNLTLNYYRFDMFTNSMFLVRSGYKHDYDTPILHTTNNGLSSDSYYDNDGYSDMLYIRTQYQKGLGFIPADLTVAVGGNYITRNSWINTSERVIKQLSHTEQVNLRSRFQSMFNGELSATYSGVSNKWGDTDNHSGMWSFTGALNFVTGQFSSQVSASHEHIKVSNADSRNEVNLGCKLEYKFNRWSIKAEGVNLLHLNNRSWQSVSQTSYYQSINFYQKIPGYMTLGITYRI